MYDSVCGGIVRFERRSGLTLLVAQFLKCRTYGYTLLGVDENSAKEGVPIRTTLQELGHKQPKTGTPLKTDNSTAHAIVHNNVLQKKSRFFETGFHWIRYRAKQGQYNVYWKPGPNNKADYVTKHHAPTVHKSQRPRYLYARPYPQHILPNILTARVC